MTGKEIRRKFLEFFEERAHRILPSASLIPVNDPSLLWTAAGMVPFKSYFTGTARPEVLRVATCQKCLRTQDIDSVGRTSRHHTFFEMLGNFSFGDYFKEEAIPWAWEFVTKELKLPEEKLWISVYLEDDEAYDIWHQKVGIPAERIVRLGKDSNYWEIGVGPCGPCSEIYVDLGEERSCSSENCGVGCDCDRFLEIWNLVFIQFFRDETGNYSPLKNKGIDTGMGLERVASVLQGVPSNFDTDLFREIIDFTGRLLRAKYGADRKTDLALKVIADHCRAVTFAVADGALPSNEGRGYVVRRLLRRAARFGRLLGMVEPFLSSITGAVIKQMADVYPELADNAKHITKVVDAEEKRFYQTLNQGTEILNQLIKEAKAGGRRRISGDDAFRLYDTYGFPLELTQEMAAEEGLTVDEDGFFAAMEEQRQRARSARQEFDYLSETTAFYKSFRDQFGETNFVGYDTLKVESRLLALIQRDQPVNQASVGEEVEFILDVTPCYAESGGQVSDHARLVAPELEVTIDEVKKPVEGLYVHKGRIIKGVLKKETPVLVEVDASRRREVSRNHSATHLLHKALKEVLGNHANQSGSLVEPERLRFDFTHYDALTPEELSRVEQLVNEVVLANLPVETFTTSLEQAQAMGASALFGEKYGEQVRVVKIGDFSLELCGGTHLQSTSEVGLFKLISESSIGAGLRRVEAVTGREALRYVNAQEEKLSRVSILLNTTPKEIIRRVEGLLKEVKKIEEENEKLRASLVRYEVQDLLAQVKELDGVRFLSARTNAKDMESLRAMVDLLRDHLGSGIIILGSPCGERVNLVAAVTRDLIPRGLHAGKLIKELASIVGGGGGGRPEMAQAGGKNPDRLQEALEKAYTIAGGQLRS